MEEDKINTMEVHRDLSLENKPVLLPEVNRQIITQIFLLGDSSMPTLMKGTTGDIPLQHSLHWHLTTPWPVMQLVDQ